MRDLSRLSPVVSGEAAGGDAMTARLVGWMPNVGRLDAAVGATARVGATPDNEIVVRVDGVSRAHAKLVEQPDGYYIEDSGSKNGTWLNGERITRARLRHLDVITLGRFAEVIFVERATEVPEPVPAPVEEGLRARLRVARWARERADCRSAAGRADHRPRRIVRPGRRQRFGVESARPADHQPRGRDDRGPRHGERHFGERARAVAGDPARVRRRSGRGSGAPVPIAARGHAGQGRRRACGHDADRCAGHGMGHAPGVVGERPRGAARRKCLQQEQAGGGGEAGTGRAASGGAAPDACRAATGRDTTGRTPLRGIGGRPVNAGRGAGGSTARQGNRAGARRLHAARAAVARWAAAGHSPGRCSG